MKIINRTEKSTAITLGKFEAMHLGHVAMADAVVDYAVLNGLSSAILSFVPSPIIILSDRGYKSLFTETEKESLIKDSNIDLWIPYPFSSELASKSPLDFCRILKSEFNCCALLVGEDFRLGHNREGTVQILTGLGLELGLQVIPVPNRVDSTLVDSTLNKNTKISTSQIRKYLSNYRIKEANLLLGRPFFITGTVEKGRQLGRTIGFPTANVCPPDNKFLPPNGVYVSRVGVQGRILTGVTNVGVNPTITNDSIRKVETFIFNFDEDIYGEELKIELIDFIRPERTFSGLEELKRQINSDAEVALQISPSISPCISQS